MFVLNIYLLLDVGLEERYVTVYMETLQVRLQLFILNADGQKGVRELKKDGTRERTYSL